MEQARKASHRALPSRSASSSLKFCNTARKNVSTTAPAMVVVKPDPWKAHCEDTLRDLESELGAVKEWPEDKHNHRQRMLLQKTVKVINDCKVLGGWASFKHSQRVAAWMAEVTRYRGCPNGELDMSVLQRPFTEALVNPPPTTRVPTPRKTASTASTSSLTVKREQLDSDALGALHCGAALGALERELSSVKDWTPSEYNLRKHKLVEKTIQAEKECEDYGGWAKYNRSIRVEAWMTEIARYRASPTAQLDMTIFNKPPFTEEPALDEKPLPTPPRTPSVSPLKSALKRRASSDGFSQTHDASPAKRLRIAVSTPTRTQAKPHRPLLGRVGYSSKSSRISSPMPHSPAFEAAMTQGTSPATRTRSRVKFILPDTTPPTTTSSSNVPADTRSVKRIREDQKERRAASKAALEDVPKLREENAALQASVVELVNTAKSQADMIRGMQAESSKFRESISERLERVEASKEEDRARVMMLERKLSDLEELGGMLEKMMTSKGEDRARIAKLEGRVEELEEMNEGMETRDRDLGAGKVMPAAVVRLVETALKTHCETTNAQIVDALKDFRGQLRGLSDSLQLQQEALGQNKAFRGHD